MRATKVHTHHPSPARRRVRMLAGLLATVALLGLAVTRMNPESKQVRADSLGRFEVLHTTLLALARVWSRGEPRGQGGAAGGGAVPMGNVLMGAECCNEDLCSKYALEACQTKRRAQRAGDVQVMQPSTLNTFEPRLRMRTGRSSTTAPPPPRLPPPRGRRGAVARIQMRMRGGGGGCPLGVVERAFSGSVSVCLVSPIR